MKSYVWIGIFIVCFFMVGCKSQPKQAIIRGEITGLDKDTIYLFGTDEFFDRIDTLFTSDGKFSKAISIDTLVFTTLLVNDSIEYPVFLDKEQTVTIQTDLHSPRVSIKGNTWNEEYSAFHNSLYATDTLSVTDKLERVEEFIRSNPSSLVSVYLLDNYFLRQDEPDYDRIKELIGSLTGDLKDLTFIQQANDLADQQGKAITGKIAPAFNLKNREDKGILRTSFRDKYLILHFWASWSDSCAQSVPQLKELYKTYKKEDKFALLGISLDINRADWEQAIEKDTIDWEQVSDFSGWNGSVIKQYGILTLPSYILIGPDARILDQKITLDSLSTKLKEIFDKKK